MKVLGALSGLMVVMCLVMGEEESRPSNGMPPFMFLSPPTFKAGHTAHLKLMFFTENTGNLTIRYYNYTQQYHPERTYFEDVLMEETFQISEESKIVDIPVKVPQNIRGQHNIQYSGNIEGFGKFQFESGTVSVRQTGYKSYVQTDKPVYKPGQPVRFRGFSIDSDLKGLTLSEGLEVLISNPDGVKVHDEVILNEDGVIHGGTFLLAEEAKIGTYTIQVVGKGSASCSFAVEEYVLPKFGVEIQGPSHIGAADTIVNGKVTATYTYGKPVNGKVVIKFAVDNKQQAMYAGAYHFQEITTELVEGEAEWEIDITDMTKKLKYLFNPFCTPSNLVIAAYVSDDQGAFNIDKVDSSTQFTQSSLKLSFNKNTQKNYAAGFPYYVELDVEALTAADVEGMPVKLTMISGLSDLTYVSEEVQVKDGKVFHSFDVPEGACAVKITAEMDIDAACDEVFACFQPERMVSKGNEFVRFVKTEPKSYSAGEQASYKILASRRLEAIHFVILSKGSIVKSWNQDADWEEDDLGRFSVEGTVIIPTDMITRSRLLVLTANPLSGHILVDAIDLCIVEELKHSMDLQIDTEIANPGDNVTLYLSSDPASFVGISVNDASLNLLREPCKVLTKDSTLSFLRDMDTGTSKDLTCKKDDPYQCTSSTEVKIIDVKDLLRSEGLSIDTNMNLFDYVAPRKESSNNRYNYWEMEDGWAAPVYAEMSSDRMYKANGMAEEAPDAMMEAEETVEAEGESEAPRMRNYFPEAWLWTDVVSDENGRNIISVVAPDTITAWKGSAFGLSPKNGLGFSNEIEFKTFLPFFISLDLPYSGIVGERITIPVRVFNYLDTDIVANVRISSDLWDTIEAEETIQSGKAGTVEYEISLTEAGNHEIMVTADTTTGESDAVRKSLLVQPGGEKIVETSSVLIMEKKRVTDKTVRSVDLPQGFIPGSHRLKAIAVGDILGEAVAGISSLIQLPSGCGEQNMHKVAVNVFSANYIKSFYDELPQNIDYNIKHNLNIGLQQQLAYRKGSSSYSNGYSVFKGGASSHWLTAFVNKVIAMFPEDVFVPCESGLNSDKDFLMRQIQYASSYQYSTGVSREGWAPYQYTYHGNSQLYWQSYFLISMLESEGRSRCGTQLRASSYNLGRVGKVCNSTLELAAKSDDCCYHHMVAYSLQLCRDNSLFDHILDWRRTPIADDSKCMGSSIDRKYKFATCQENLEYESVRSSSKSIEATAYAALYFMQKGSLEDSLPMIMWLASQRNENGGFRSSQDTVMGLQALAQFAELSSAEKSKSTDLNIFVGKGKTYFEKIRIREETKLTIKEVVLSPEVGDYKLKWTGVGTAFVQLVSSYHIIGKEYLPIYGLKADAMIMEDLPAIIVSFLLPRESASTMYLLEIRAPTGMVFSKSLVEGQFPMTDGGRGLITRYDIKEGGQRLHLYVDPNTKEKDIELSIPMDIKFDVSSRMPAQVSLIDYYNPAERETVFYSIDTLEDGEEEEAGCSLDLSCDLFQNADVILIGFPGEYTDESLVIDRTYAYKACSGFTTSMGDSERVKFDNVLLRKCVYPLMNTKSVFLLRDNGDEQFVLTGMADYQSFVPITRECASFTECPM